MASLAPSITRNLFSLHQRSLFLATIAIAMFPSQTSAQSIIPATDGTGTAVTQQGDNYTIDAGSLSADGANLFHSFEAFSLSSEETANFLTQPNVQNILASVSGGSPSILNGLLQINSLESAPNLFLMNPAGVLFGANAQINLPGNLTVTTADAIGFDQQAWFNVSEANTYASLTGNPTGEFAFLAAPFGSIVNEGNLSLSANSSLTLLSGSIVNTGTLSAPGSGLTLAALPSPNPEANTLVRLSPADSLLSIEVSADDLRSLTTQAIPSLSLAQLLTHSEPTTAEYADTLILNADGSASISGTVSTQTTAPQSTGGDITVIGKQINITNAQVLAAGQAGGGRIRIGGNYRGEEGLPTANKTAVDRHVVLDASAIEEGNGGSAIIWADETTQYAGQITVRGGRNGGNGGFVEVSGKESLLFRGEVDTSAPNGQFGSLLLDPENIIITAGSTGLNDEALSDASIFFDEGSASETFTISENLLEGLSGNTDVTLEASNNILIEALDDGVLSFAAGNGDITLTADADGSGDGDILSGGSDYEINAPGRSLSLSGQTIALRSISTAGLEQGGNITLQAEETLTVNSLSTSSPNISGDIELEANADITAQSIITNGGDVLVDSLFGGNYSGLNLSVD
ncbi:MAG: filamentous hemagglutinin N-terminal domain-containing protein [Phormidesmis sp.]